MSSDSAHDPSMAIDYAIEETGYEAILRRLSSDLDTPIELGDGTLYEDGDQHTPGDMDAATSADSDEDEELPR